MKLTELCKSIGLMKICGNTDVEYSGVYAGDLLSRAMSHVKEKNLWITIMPNANVIAVASLTECAAVILAEGVELIPEALDAAMEHGITVLSSSMTAYEICISIKDAEDRIDV